ncbi:MAG: hypothetical protein JXR40_08290 [Pontiellaceae bacterium]|nr:hypothetical protein [Pontiellaceae bacterium]
MKRTHVIVGVCSLAGLLYAESAVTDSQSFQAEGSTKRIFRGKVELPAQGVWQVDGGSSSLFLIPPDEVYDQLMGRRMSEVAFEERVNEGRYALSSITWDCRRYAETNNLTGPASIDELDEYTAERFNSSPWEDISRARDLEGPYFFLIPNVQYAFSEDGMFVPSDKRELLAFELCPYVNDGKHWVCYTDGSTERVEVDQEMIKRYGVSIRPVYEKAPFSEGLPDTYVYSVYASVRNAADLDDELSIRLENTYSDQQMDISWDIATATPGDEALAEEMREMEVWDWMAYRDSSRSSVLQTWMALEEVENRNDWRASRRNETSSALGVMGGYAALRETLQMQLITPDEGASAARTISVASIEGVQVKSHPYEEMLDGNPGGQLALAELAPADHLFVYLAQPEALLPILDNGADFISELGGTLTGNRIKYNLEQRYLARMGLSEEWLRLFLKSGGVKECAVLVPDLFLLDGTDLTVVSRLSKPALIKPLLAAVGVDVLSGGRSRTQTDAGECFWAFQDDLLMVSTSASELDRVLALHKNGGEGSLGKSAEFRYMLTQLTLSEQTRAYAYCSDPFIRKLVSPETKIGQLRRVRAMEKLTVLTSGALLAEQDGFGTIRSIEELKAKGYLPETVEIDSAEYSLEPDLTARSVTYGTLADLAAIDAVPVDWVTAAEADAYMIYVENYSRFWRQFFDPIALRLNDAPDGTMEAELFILPLIDSSIYQMVREVIATHEDEVPMSVPTFSPEPVLQFSVNLKDSIWTLVTEGLSEILTQYWDVDSAIMDDLGPSLHLAVNDGDPVIALGSGDILGAFGADGIMMADEEMFFIPVLLSVLTRPCTIAIETSNPEKTIMHLRQASEMPSYSYDRWTDDITSEFYRVGDDDSWVCMFDIAGIVKLRFGLEVQDGFLLIRNIPWSNKDRIVGVKQSDLNGARLDVWPAACKLQLPGLFSAAAEKERAAAFQGMGFLYPLLSSGHTQMESAFDDHMKLFGFTPRLAAGDAWIWENQTLESKLYGSIYRKQQPAFSEDDELGLLGVLRKMSLGMQFEDTGLRVSLKWKSKD